MTIDHKKEKYISRLNIMDDVFFHKIAEDPEASEEIIGTIIEKEIKIIESQAQKYLRNIDNRSVVLDALCKDSTGKYYNIEVQKQDNNDHQRRVRYNGSNIDTMFTEQSIGFKDIPDVYVIYISEFDIFKAGKALYHIKRIVSETGEEVDNGFYEIYTNLMAPRDGSKISELLTYLTDSTGRNSKFPKLSKRVNYFKQTKKGVEEMSKIVEEIMLEGEKRGEKRGEKKGERTIIMSMFNKKIPVEEIAWMTGKSVETIKKIIDMK